MTSSGFTDLKRPAWRLALGEVTGKGGYSPYWVSWSARGGVFLETALAVGGLETALAVGALETALAVGALETVLAVGALETAVTVGALETALAVGGLETTAG